MKKKVLFAVLGLLIVASLAGAGTFAYFTDTEKSTNNTMVAGTLDLTVDSTDAAVTTVDVFNKAPGDSGVGTTVLKNVGSLEGELEITMSAITNTESTGTTEYEGDGDPGELGAYLKMVLWIDVDKSGTFNSGDVELLSDGTVAAYDAVNNTALTYDIANNYDSDSWDVAETMAAGAEDNFVISWEIPTGTGNSIQGDSMSFDVSFLLEQAAND